MSNTKAEKELKLEKLWDELLLNSPTNDQLADVARIVPTLRERAWQKYREAKPSRQELLGMTRAQEWTHLRRYSALLLIELYPNRHTLLYLVQDVKEVLTEATEKLLGFDLDNETLVLMLSAVRNISTLRQRVARKLLMKSPNAQELCSILDFAPEVAEEAAKELLKDKAMTQDDVLVKICYIAPALVPDVLAEHKERMSEHALVAAIVANPACREEVGRLILQKSELFYHIFQVFELVPSLRKDAWKKLSALELSRNQLLSIGRVAPEFATEASARIKPEPRTANYIFAEIVTVN